jgi:hypothetical protein
MTASGKIRIYLNLDEKDIFSRHSVVSDAFVRTIDGTGYSMLEIRMVVPEAEADGLLFGMLSGNAEFRVESIIPLLAMESL